MGSRVADGKTPTALNMGKMPNMGSTGSCLPPSSCPHVGLTEFYSVSPVSEGFHGVRQGRFRSELGGQAFCEVLQIPLPPVLLRPEPPEGMRPRRTSPNVKDCPSERRSVSILGRQAGCGG